MFRGGFLILYPKSYPQKSAFCASIFVTEFVWMQAESLPVRLAGLGALSVYPQVAGRLYGKSLAVNLLASSVNTIVL